MPPSRALPMPPSALTRRVRIGLLLLFVAALSLRLGFCWFKTGFAASPSYREYAMAGRRLLEQGALLSSWVLDDDAASPSALLPPAYVAWVAGAYALLGTESFAAECALQVANALASALAAIGLFFVARRLAGDRAGWIAAVVLAINPLCFGYVNLVWDTSLFLLGIVVTLYFCVRLREGPGTMGRWFVFGLWLGALALLNPALTIAYPFLVLWPLTKSCGWRPGPVVGRVMLTVLGWLLVVTPWNVRNYVQLGEVTYVRGGLMMEFWLGSCPEADTDGSAVYKSQYPLDNADVQRRVAEIGEVAYIDECGRKATEAIMGNPWRFVRLVGMRAVDYWLGTAYSHNPAGAGGIPRSTPRVAVMVFLMLELLALVILLLIRHAEGRDVRWLLAVATAFCLIYCLTHVQIRFRAPSEPLIAVAVGFLAARSFPSRERRGR